MSKHRVILFTLIFCVIKLPLFSQTPVFTNNPDSLIQELNSYFHSPQTEILNSHFVAFQENWEQGLFNKEQKVIIQSIIQKVYKRGLKKNNVLKFIKTLNLFIIRKQKENSLFVWLQITNKLVNHRSSRKYIKFIDQSINLLKDQQLNRMASMKWMYRGGHFYYEFDYVLKVWFKGGDLYCKSRNDSSQIIGTNGVFYPLQNKWIGKGGVLNWNRVGKAKEMFAEFKSYYSISLSQSQFSADSVLFLDTKYFKIPMFGKLTEKILASKPSLRTSYPRFNSYEKNYRLDSLLSAINFVGGIHVQGAKIICDAKENKLASMEFYRDSFPFVKVVSKEFVLFQNHISSARAKILILLDQDSILHSAVRFKYDHKNCELTFSRKARGLAPSPFNNSYHKVDMYCEEIVWKLDSVGLELTNRKNVAKRSEAVFESVNYYSAYDYYRIQGLDLVNPMIVIKKYSEVYNTNLVHLELLAEYIKKPREQASNMLFNLAEKGFVTYDVESKTALIQKRLFDFLQAKAGLQDHDVIRLKSETKGKSSATLNLNNYDLLIRGIDEIYLSDSQKVQILPYKNEVLMKKNRDFLFRGDVKGGLFNFSAGDCEFQYNEFKLNMPNIDSVSFSVRNPNPTKENPEKFIKVKSVLANLSGDVRIDNPENKSGNLSYPEYPIFRNKNEAYVYYEDSLIMEGSLKKDRFYYFVKPFVIDSLDNFSTDGLGFAGYMVADSIFPVINKDLQVMGDYSLGFKYTSPEEGIPMYKRKGTFYNKINLSNEGFYGNGKLQWLSSNASSEKFYIYPDSLIGLVSHFSIKPIEADTSLPDVQVVNADFKWTPYSDRMKIQSIDSLFSMFTEKARLKGELILEPSKLKGSGLFQFENFNLRSNDFNFSGNCVQSDTTNFDLFTKEAKELAFSSQDYKASICFKNRRGIFKSNGKESVLRFPFNNYISSVDEMIWNMDSSEMVMFSNIGKTVQGIDSMSHEELLDIDLSGSYFVSLRPDQDSLSFYSLKTRYDMNNYILYAEDVKYINVANAAVFPSDGMVTIKQNAEIPTLKGATIISDVNNRFHKVYNADVNIFSKNNFIANGSYDYLDANKTPQEIKLNTVSVDSLGRTFALGTVPDEELFFINPHFFFKGDVKWTSDNPYVRFYGGFRLNHECFFNDSIWVRFDTIINPEKVQLPVDNLLLDLKKNRLDIGLFYSPTEGVLYNRYFASKPNIKDRDVFKARGVVQFDENEQSFKVGSKDKLAGKTYYGNQYNLNIDKCFLKGSGTLTLTDGFREVLVNTYGECYHSIIKDTTGFRVLLSLDFMFDENSLNLMIDSLKNAELDKIRMNDDFIRMVMVNAAKKESEKDILYDLEWHGEIKKNLNEYKEKLIFSDVYLRWDAEKRIYKSVGKIGIGMIDNNQINCYVNGLIVIDRKKSNNSIDIYLELKKENWYYFGLKNKVMQAISSDKIFNAKLSEVESSERMLKKDDIIQYEFVISSRKKKIDFLRKYKMKK